VSRTSSGGGGLLDVQPQQLSRSKSVHVSATVIHSVSKPGKSAFQRSPGKEDDDDEDYDEEDDDQFFDCRENLDDTSSLAKWSSMDLPPYDEDGTEGGNRESMSSDRSDGVEMRPKPSACGGGGGTNSSSQLDTNPRAEPHVTFRRVQSMREGSSFPKDNATDAVGFVRPIIDVADFGACPTTVLILVAHGGSVLDLEMEVSVRKSDVTTFRGAFESVMRTHYPWMVGHVAIKCVPCPAVCSEALAVLSSLSPYR
jgi:hypothetical protein